jgi:uncharacterized metal-binding protein
LKGEEMSFLDLFMLAIGVISIGMLIHLVMDARGFFDERREQRKKEKVEREEAKET